jgi:F-type H+-transporting ATPase subunit gamma
MQAAQKNLSERQDELLSAFRRLRQDAITNELLDVVAGYEALQHAPAIRAAAQ